MLRCTPHFFRPVQTSLRLPCLFDRSAAAISAALAVRCAYQFQSPQPQARPAHFQPRSRIRFSFRLAQPLCSPPSTRCFPTAIPNQMPGLLPIEIATQLASPDNVAKFFRAPAKRSCSHQSPPDPPAILPPSPRLRTCLQTLSSRSTSRKESPRTPIYLSDDPRF